MVEKILPKFHRDAEEKTYQDYNFQTMENLILY